MRRRKFLAWVAGLPFVTLLFPGLAAKEIKAPKPEKTTEEFKEFCRESLEYQLVARFHDRRCEVVTDCVALPMVRLGFTSMLFNMNDFHITDENIEARLYKCMGDIADSVKGMSGVDSSKTPDIKVRILSLDRLDRRHMANDRNGKALGLDDEVTVEDFGNWLVLKWDVGSEGFFEWIR